MYDKTPFEDGYEKYKKSPHQNPYWDTPPKTPKKPQVSITDLFPRIDRWGIGFDPIFGHLQSFTASATAPSYPPYNIIKDTAVKGRWEIAIAVAGFTREDLTVTHTERTLTVETADVERADAREVVHQGIAQRDFTLNFALADYVEPTSVKLENGLLIIVLETNLPEEKKPKVIDIN